MYGKDLNSYLPSVFALPLTAQPPFSHSPLLCLISRSLSSQAPACPRDSETLNIHPLSSIAPTVLLEEGKKWHWIIQGPIRAISGDCLDLDEMAQRALSVCVFFWCGASVNSMSILSCHNYRHYTIMQGSSNAYFSSRLQFPINAARLKGFNRSTKPLYDVLQEDLFYLMHG